MDTAPRRILFATDLSDQTRPAQTFAQTMAARFGAEFHLLHVVPESASGTAVSPSPCPSAGSSAPVPTLVSGNLVLEIADYVKLHQIDLVMLGSHRACGFDRLSLTEMLTRLLPCPVLSYHASEASH